MQLEKPARTFGTMLNLMFIIIFFYAIVVMGISSQLLFIFESKSVFYFILFSSLVFVLSIVFYFSPTLGIWRKVCRYKPI